MQSLNRSRKIIILMKLKMSLIKVLSFTSQIVSMMEKIVISIKHFYQNFNTNENFYLLNRTIRQPQNQNEFLTLIYLKSTRRVFYHCFQLTMLKNLIYTLIKMQNIYSIDLMIALKRLTDKNKPSSITQKLKIQLVLRKQKREIDNFLLKK